MGCFGWGGGQKALMLKRSLCAFSVDAAFLLTIGNFLLTAELFCLQLCLGAFLLTIRASLLTI